PGPTSVPGERQQRDIGPVVRASHNGYVERFGLVHQRTLLLHPNGMRLDGEDIFVPAGGGNTMPSDARDDFALRFHLHPSVRANRLTDGHGVMLTTPNKEVWTFNSPEDEVDIEESVYLASPEGPRRTVQIVIRGRARHIQRVLWTFSYVQQQQQIGQSARSKGRGRDPQLPL